MYIYIYKQTDKLTLIYSKYHIYTMTALTSSSVLGVVRRLITIMAIEVTHIINAPKYV